MLRVRSEWFAVAAPGEKHRRIDQPSLGNGHGMVRCHVLVDTDRVDIVWSIRLRSEAVFPFVLGHVEYRLRPESQTAAWRVWRGVRVGACERRERVRTLQCGVAGGFDARSVAKSCWRERRGAGALQRASPAGGRGSRTVVRVRNPPA